VNGNTSALQRQFPWLDKNKDGTVTLAEATTGLGKAYAGAAKSAQNNDPWKVLNTIWGQLKEQLGQWILPLLKRFSDWFKDPANQKAVQDMLIKVGNLAKELGEKLVPKLNELLRFLSSPNFKNEMARTADDMKAIADATLALVGALARLIGWLRTAWGWLNNVANAAERLDKILFGKWGGRGYSLLGRSATQSTATSTASATPTAYAAPTMTTTSTTMTINVNGTANPQVVARELSRLISGANVRTGYRGVRA
jgi:hypothetical protein